MRANRIRIAGPGLLALAACAGALATTAGPVVGKQGVKDGSRTAKVTKKVNRIVPAGTATPPFIPGVVSSRVRVGKKFKGTIDDVDVQMNANATGPLASIGALNARLTAPNGTSTILFNDGLFGTQLGPLLLDDETPIFLNHHDPGVFSDPQSLDSPYSGRAAPDAPLSNLDGGPANGRWTLVIRNDDDDSARVHTLVSWKLRVKTRPKRHPPP